MKGEIMSDYSRLSGDGISVYCMLPDCYAKQFNLDSANSVCLINLDDRDTVVYYHLDCLEIRRTLNGKSSRIVAAYLEIYALLPFLFDGKLNLKKGVWYRDLPKESPEYSIHVGQGAANDDNF